jgi:hypothetical protein
LNLLTGEGGRGRKGGRSQIVEEGRAASQSPHSKFSCFLSMPQQAVSVDIIPNSAVEIFFPKNRRNKDKNS